MPLFRRLRNTSTPEIPRGRHWQKTTLSTAMSVSGQRRRGAQTLMLGAKVLALLDGRANVSYDDVDRIAVPTLNHRLVLNFAAEAESIDPRDIVVRIIQSARKLRR